MNQRELFLRFVAQTSDEPMLGYDMNIAKAEGSFLYDVNGKEYLDLISGIAVSNIGHRHPKVLESIRAQSEKYLHLMVYGEYNQRPQVEYAALLCSLLPDPLNLVYFTTGGSEAVEGAMKLAKRASGRAEFISFNNAYHGSTQGSMSLMGSEVFKQSFRPLLPGMKQLVFNNEDGLNQISESTAAVIIEPIQGEAGVMRAEASFLKALRKRCNEKGALLILDEIQSGFGRTGTLFAFQQYDIVPDVLLLAKGMGGGLPVGAFVASRDLMCTLCSDPVLGHINTFGGNALCVAAAKATLEVILEENLCEKAKDIQTLIQNTLKAKKIKSMRVCGALAAAEFDSEEVCKNVLRACLEQGIISDWFLFCPGAMRIAPPLNIDLNKLESALRTICSIIEREG
ncbi:MAG TPA: aspartate aminotransferase family protein [Bacteroidia bacterium]|nr:aspartate aminotransferase family protein [Bacteroidia bacterium]